MSTRQKHNDLKNENQTLNLVVTHDSMMIPKTVVHCLSGGLDSVTLLYQLVGSECVVHCLLFDYGQRHKQELTFAQLHCRRLNVPFTTITLPQLRGSALTDGKDTSWVVPFRNAVLLSHAVNFAVEAKAECVTIGINADDAAMFRDCESAFIAAMKQAVKISGVDVEICAPYIQKHKWEIGAIARENAVPSHEIWSCYRGGEKPCGECPACVKLQEAIKQECDFCGKPIKGNWNICPTCMETKA